MQQRYFKVICFLFLFFNTICSVAQTSADKDAFAETFIKIFQNRSNRFDSITRFNKVIDGSYDAVIKLPGADKCVIKYNKYLADYGFMDKAGATTFFKTLQNWLNYAAGAYSSKALFLPYDGDPERLQFFLSDSSGFIDAENYLRITTSKSAKPFVVHLEIDSNPAIAYYTNLGGKINNAALISLVKDIGFGKDIQMTKIKKNKKATEDGYLYESTRSLPGYKASISEYTDDSGSENKLQLLTKWTGQVQTVNKKVDSLILMLKAALPASYCYRIDTDRQAVFFYQHPFTKDSLDASFAIEYGLNEGQKNSYYAALVITRFLETEPEEEIAEPNLRPFKDAGGKYGYKDGSGKIIVPAKYDEAASFREDRACVVLNKRYGYIDGNGKEIIPLKYDYASLFFFDGIAEIVTNRKYGLVDKSGKEIVPPRYDKMERAKLNYDEKGKLKPANDFILVKSAGKAGFINYSGQEIIPLKYEDAVSIGPSTAIIKLNNLWGMIDMTGKLLAPAIYDYIHTSDDRKNEYVSPRLNKKYGLMDKNGKLLIHVKYDRPIYGFSENLAVAVLDGKAGFIDKTGKEVIPRKYEEVDDFSNGLAQAKMNGKWGFIDKTGKEVIPFKYENSGSFSEGLAAVQLNGKWGYINKTGKTVILFSYDYAGDFDEDGEAKVYIGKKWGKINTKGLVVKPIVNEGSDDDDGW